MVSLGWAVLVPLAVAVCLRLLRLDHNVPMVAVNGLTLWVYLPAWVVLAVASLSRSRPLLAVALAVVVAHLSWVTADLGASRTAARADDRAPLRLLTSNLFMDNEQLDAMAAAVLAADADVLFLQEVQAHHVAALEDAGVSERYPYAIVQPRPDQFGAAIYSQLPLDEVSVIAVGGSRLVEADVTVDGRAVRLLNVHTKAPVTRSGLRQWTAQLTAIDDAIEAAQADGHPVIVAGDFNATRHHRPFRALIDPAMREAHQAAGRGLARTWPTTWPAVPRLMRLDHVLVSHDIAVRSVTEERVPGSDHLSVLASVLLS